MNNPHKNARTTQYRREQMVKRVLEQRQPVEQVARAFAVSVRTVRKWIGRYLAEGRSGLENRSSRPRSIV